MTSDAHAQPERDAHPLLAVLLDAAAGSFPAVDGRARIVGPLAGGLQAVVSFTGHAIVATSLTADQLEGLELDGFGAALHPTVLQAMAGLAGRIGVIDATLVAAGRGGGRLPVREDLDDHPRVRLARRLRTHVRVHADERGLVTLSQGLAGRTELSVEIREDRQGTGGGPSFIREGLRLVAPGEPVFAAVSPGNARSLRAFLRAGFIPIGSEVLIQTAPMAG